MVIGLHVVIDTNIQLAITRSVNIYSHNNFKDCVTH